MTTPEHVTNIGRPGPIAGVTPQARGATEAPCPASGLAGQPPSGTRIRCPVCQKPTWVTSGNTIPYHRAPRPRTGT